MNSSLFGTMLSLSGAGGVTNAYQTSAPVQAGATSFLLFKVAITTDAASTLTGLNVKVQGVFTAGGTDAGDVISYKMDTNTAQPELVHAYSALTVGTSSVFFFKCRDTSCFAGGIQVAAQGTFSAGGSKAGDAVTISAAGW